MSRSITFFLLLLTWLGLGTVFIGVKSGVIRPDEISASVSERFATTDAKIAALDNKISALEKKLSDMNGKMPSPAENGTSAPDTTTTPGAEEPESMMVPSPATPAAPAENPAGTTPPATAPAAPADNNGNGATAPVPGAAVPSPEKPAATEPTKPGASKNNDGGKEATLQKQVGELSDAMENLQAARYSNALVVSAVNLRDAVKRGHEYEHELSFLRAYSKEDPYLAAQAEVLSKNARYGLPEVSILRQAFGKVSEKILMEELQTKQNKSLLDKVALNFSGVVTVRKINGEENSTKPEDIIARADSLMTQGKLAQSITELKKLPVGGQEAFSAWFAQAENYVSSVEACDNIFKYVTSPERTMAVTG